MSINSIQERLRMIAGPRLSSYLVAGCIGAIVGISYWAIVSSGARVAESLEKPDSIVDSDPKQPSKSFGANVQPTILNETQTQILIALARHPVDTDSKDFLEELKKEYPSIDGNSAVFNINELEKPDGVRFIEFRPPSRARRAMRYAITQNGRKWLSDHKLIGQRKEPNLKPHVAISWEVIRVAANNTVEVVIVLFNGSDVHASTTLEIDLRFVPEAGEIATGMIPGSSLAFEVPPHKSERYRYNAGFVMSEAMFRQLAEGKATLTLGCKAYYPGGETERSGRYSVQKKNFVP